MKKTYRKPELQLMGIVCNNMIALSQHDGTVGSGQESIIRTREEEDDDFDFDW